MFRKFVSINLILIITLLLTSCNKWEKISYTDTELKEQSESFNNGHTPWKIDPYHVTKDFFSKKLESDIVEPLINIENMTIRYTLGIDKYLEVKLEFIDSNLPFTKVSAYRYVNKKRSIPDWIKTKYTPDHESSSNIQSVIHYFIESQLDEIEITDIDKNEIYLRFESEKKVLDCKLIQPVSYSEFWVVESYQIKER